MYKVTDLTAIVVAAVADTCVGHRNLDIVVFAAVELDDSNFVFDNVVRTVAAIVIAFADDDMHLTTLLLQQNPRLQLQQYLLHFCYLHCCYLVQLAKLLPTRRMKMTCLQLLYPLQYSVVVVGLQGQTKTNLLMMSGRRLQKLLSVWLKLPMKPNLLKVVRVNFFAMPLSLR